MQLYAFSIWLSVSWLQGSVTEQVCHPDDLVPQDSQLLRSMSLSLRGKPLTAAEYQGLENASLSLVIDGWLASDEFAEQAVIWHRDLLWNRLDNINFSSGSELRREGEVYYRDRVATMLRGERVPCLDEPAVITDGVIQTTEVDGTFREGWIEMTPYWDPEATLKVCAFDAQLYAVSSSGTDCSSIDALGDTECGCGEGLRYCSTRDVGRRVADSIGRDIDERVRALISEDASYLDLFLRDEAYVDGALAHYLRYLAPFSREVGMRPSPVPPTALPDLDYDDETFVPISLDAEHAGVLTSPGFLLRYQTNRARASKFYEVFRCEPFQPPPGGLPPGDDACSLEADLQARCGCKYCHALLEPAASHFGRWGEYGAGFLDQEHYPDRRDDCESCGRGNEGCSQDCREHYIVSATSPDQAPFIGMLKAFEFRRPEHEAFVGLGPKNMVTEAVVDGSLSRCVAQRTSERLLGRELGADDDAWLESLASAFVQNGFNYRSLVKAILLSERYRSLR